MCSIPRQSTRQACRPAGQLALDVGWSTLLEVSDSQSVRFQNPAELPGSAANVLIQYRPELPAVILDPGVDKLVQDHIIPEFCRKPGQIYVEAYVVHGRAATPLGLLISYRDIVKSEVVHFSQFLQSLDQNGSGSGFADPRQTHLFTIVLQLLDFLQVLPDPGNP